jgi:hypothetical protein
MFATRSLDPSEHPDRDKVQVVYLDEALAALAARNPNHPAIAVFAPLLTTDRSEVATQCPQWYKTLQTTGALDPSQRTRYVDVFCSWVLQRLGLKNLQDLDMLITDLPELEDTDFYRLVLEKGRIQGEAKGIAQTLLRLGRQRWGVEPADIPARLETLTEEQLNELTDQMLELANWEALRSAIPAKAG